MPDELLNVLLFTPEKIIYEGTAHRVILPGERGVFEVLPFHKKLISRLIHGHLIIDNNHLAIKRGVAKVGLDKVVLIVEEDLGE